MIVPTVRALSVALWYGLGLFLRSNLDTDQMAAVSLALVELPLRVNVLSTVIETTLIACLRRLVGSEMASSVELSCLCWGFNH